MAANTYRTTREFNYISSGLLPIIPGDNRRRALIFSIEGLNSTTSIDPTPIGNSDTPMFWPFNTINRFELDYMYHGILVCEPWYVHTGGLPLSICVIEILQLP